jgi:C4-dicarboxylate-binding protein DctP
MKSREKIALAVGFILVLVGAAASPVQAAKYKIKWLLGHQNRDYFEEAAQNFKKTVEARSHGDISVEIVLGDALESAPGRTSSEIAAAVARGEAEMGHSFTDVMGGVDPKLYAFEAPYLMRDYRHMEGVFEGPVGEGMLADLRTHHIVGLSFTYSGGASGVAANREIRGPEDLKGLKVGVYGDAVNKAWLKSLGATPVALEHGLDKILPLERAGQLDAVVITWRNLERQALNQGFKKMNLMGSTYLVSVTYINEKFYEGLPAEYRKLLKDASQEAGRIERAKTIELNENSKREMLAKGVSPVYLSEEGRGRFVEALKPAYEGTLEGVIGKDLIEKIKATKDGAVYPTIPHVLATR